MDARQKYELWKAKADSFTLRELGLMPENEIEDAFYKDLEFGTAGIRGKMGAGTNRLNLYAVKKLSQGVADFLKSQNPKNPLICISYDSRNNSRLFATAAAAVFAANNIKVILTKTLMPTPYLSFITRHFKADMGVMITASHNPKEYNGYKVYGNDGCQLTDTAASKLKEFIDKINAFEVNPLNFNNYLQDKKIRITALKNPYLNEVKKHCPHIIGKKLRITYTPLNGTGGALVSKILSYLGHEINLVKEQFKPSGDFETCPNPNPESSQAYELAIKYAQENNSDLILATDPDADRVGVMVKTANGYKSLSGNEIGALLTLFLLRKDASVSRKIIVRTVVSTCLADKIAAKHGAEVKEVLTGFKYIGEYVGELEKTNAQNRFLLGFEDSLGYLSGGYVRDKDAVLASMLIAQMTSEYLAQNKTLIDAIEEIYAEFGYHLHKTVSFKLEGDKGSLKILDIMDKLRRGSADFGLPLKNKKDYMSPQSVLPLTNMIELDFTAAKVIVRPSGTEPLIKLYITAIGDKEDCQETYKKLADAFKKEFEL